MISYHKRSRLIKKIVLWSVIAAGVIALFIPTLTTQPVQVSAQDDGGSSQEQIDVCQLSNGCVKTTEEGLKGVAGVIIYIAKIMTYLAAAVSVIYMIIGAFFMITSVGNQNSWEKGVNTLKYAVIGLIVALVARLLIELIVDMIENLRVST